MRFDNRHIFTGDINGVTLNDFKQLDFKKTSLEERLDVVNNLLYSNVNEQKLNFFENYVDKHYKFKLNSGDELSENHNVFKTLENMANYLLGSTEIREQRKKDEQQYKFYIDESEFRLRVNKEQLFENVANDNDISTENVIHFLLTSQNENHKIVSQTSVAQKDIHEDTYCGEVLRQYNQMLVHVDKQIKNPDEKYKGKRYLLTKAKRDLLDDMTLVKVQLKGITKPKNLLKDSTCTDWNCFKWSNHKHVKELLYVRCGFHPENDISFLVLDVENLVKEMFKNKKLTNSEFKIYKMIRQGYKNNEIADILQVNRTYISNTVAIITKKVSNYAVSKHWDE